jgi:hypothetical protein
MLNLRADRRLMVLVRRSLLLRSGTGADSAVATVIADVRVVVDDYRFVVDVSDVGDVNVVHAPVVKVAVALPISAIKTTAGVAKAVIDTAVKSDVRTPVSIVPVIETVVPTPVSGSPKLADGGEHPRARDPVVAIIVIPCPITRRPDVSLSGTKRLNVNRQRRWTDPYRNSHAELSMGDTAQRNHQNQRR